MSNLGMNSIGQIRIRKIDDLLPADSLLPSLEDLETKYNPNECVDLTADICSTPITKKVKNENRTKQKQIKEPIAQTKLDAFFQKSTVVKKAPKIFKKSPGNINIGASTSPVVTQTGREHETNSKRNVQMAPTKKTKKSPKTNDETNSVATTKPRLRKTRRKLLELDDEPKKTKRSKKSTTNSDEDSKKQDDAVPTVIPGIIDLCCSDSEDERDRKRAVKVPPIPQRPTTVKSEKATCPSYKVVEGTTFAVDGFRFGRIEGVTVYFLTHFHADHYIGLSGKFSMPIYMSKITANLLRAFIPVDEKLINILPMNTTIVIDGVQITAIDANHCPGAVMLLFQLPCGKRMLHTGDFRASLEMELDPHLKQRNIDILYLDTTYISNKYSFQPQAKSIADAIQLIRVFKEKNEGKRILFVCGAYLVGKEKFWSPIAKAFDFKVWTDDKRRKVLRAIDDDEILQRLVPNAREADLHVISLMKVGYKGIYEYWKEFTNSFDMIFAIRPSGWEKNSKPQYRGEVNIIGIEYSEHSSHDEMRRFVGFIKPNEVISTVPCGRDPTKCSIVPLSWYRKECFSPIKKQASIFKYLEVKRRE